MTGNRYIVYKAENLINKKVYIGYTNNFKRRIAEHKACYDSDDCYFHRALKHYGNDNFEWTIIDKNLTKEVANQKEKYYIEKFNSFYKSENSNGYNMTKGGDGGCFWNSKPILLFDDDFNIIKKFDTSFECGKFLNTRGSSVRSACNRFGKCRGYIVRFEKDYLEKGLFIPKKTCRKKILRFSLDGEYIDEFPSIINASISLGISRTGIISCLTGTYKFAGGYMWRYKEKFNGVIEPVPKNYGKKINKIIQLDLDGNYLNEFNSCVEACKFIGRKTYKVIHKSLDDFNKTAYGYKWVRYKTYYKDNTEVTD